MRISAIQSYNQQNSLKRVQQKDLKANSMSKTLVTPEGDTVAFQGKASKIFGSAVGGAIGGAMSTATISGGTAAGLAALAAGGPIGWGLLGLYAGTGLLIGGAFGKMIAEIVDRDD